MININISCFILNKYGDLNQAYYRGEWKELVLTAKNVDGQ